MEAGLIAFLIFLIGDIIILKSILEEKKSKHKNNNR